jgi:hypothetical protein
VSAAVVSAAVVSTGAGVSVLTVSSAAASSVFLPPQATKATTKAHTANVANTFFMVYRFLNLLAKIQERLNFKPRGNKILFFSAFMTLKMSYQPLGQTIIISF